MSGRLFSGIPAEDYHADICDTPSLSSGIAKLLLSRSPLHAWAAHPKLGNAPREKGDDDKFDYGSACHDVLLEGGSRLAVVNPEEYRSKPTKANPEGSIPKGWTNDAIREAREVARGSGKIPVLPVQANRIMRMTEGANRFIQGSALATAWEGGESEVTCTWSEHGIWLRCRFDRLNKGAGINFDYKSTTDASPDGFGRQILRMGYHIQDAFYRRGMKACGIDDPKFYFLAQEVSAPHPCSWHECDTELRMIADAKVEQAIRIWGECLSANKWPSYGNQINNVLANSWMMEQAVTDGTLDMGYREPE